jgi:hypothetical protein
VTWSGTGVSFKRINLDGQPSASAVLTGPSSRIELERGQPDTPYLAAATARITNVSYRAADSTLTVQATGITGQQAEYTLLSPMPLKRIWADSYEVLNAVAITELEKGVYRLSFRTVFTAGTAVVTFEF